MEPRNAGAGANVNGGYKSLESWNCKIKREPVEVAEDGANTMSEEDDVAAKFLTIEMEPEEMSCAAETTEETKAGAQAKQSTPTKTMAEGPTGPKQLVIVEEILQVEDMLAEKLTLRDVCLVLWTPEMAAQWLVKRGLLKNSYQCPMCKEACSAISCQESLDGLRWCCSHCNRIKSIRVGSIFSKSHLPLNTIVVIIYCWTTDCWTQEDTAREACIDLDTVVGWYNILREECVSYMNRHPISIGGFDDSGRPIIVEIDETEFFRRKCQKGHWVFGGMERDSGKFFMVEVSDRSETTLTPLIEKHIQPGTLIVSDGWEAYNNIGDIQGGVYLHSAATHVDPAHPETHIRNIQNLWLRTKRKLRNESDITENFTSCLQIFILRNLFPGSFFSQMLVCIRENYVL